MEMEAISTVILKEHKASGKSFLIKSVDKKLTSEWVGQEVLITNELAPSKYLRLTVGTVLRASKGRLQVKWPTLTAFISPKFFSKREGSQKAPEPQWPGSHKTSDKEVAAFHESTGHSMEEVVPGKSLEDLHLAAGLSDLLLRSGASQLGCSFLHPTASYMLCMG